MAYSARETTCEGVRALRLDFTISHGGGLVGTPTQYCYWDVTGGWDTKVPWRGGERLPYLRGELGWLIAVIKSGRPGPYRLFPRQEQHCAGTRWKNVASLYLLGKDWLCKFQADLLDQLSATPASMRK